MKQLFSCIFLLFKNVLIINIKIKNTINKNFALLAKVKGEVCSDEDNENNADNEVVEEDASYEVDDEAEEEDSAGGIFV